MKWLIERTDVTPSKYFARWYGGDQWTEEPMAALQFDTKHAAHQEWIDSLQKNPSLKPFEDKVEMCEHQF
ncbi:MAG TPA: hypothetical protein VIE65_15505 [Methylobacter sp.]|jgi:hypothetical protein